MNGGFHRGVALASSIVGASAVALDGTVLTVVQPVLQRDLDATVAQVQWAGTGYLVAVASLLVLAGRLGDRHGHERLFALGILGFGAASAGIAVAPDIGWVIGLRVVQGVFGALLQPATLGMLRTSFPPDRLAGPIALRTVAIGLAAAAGPLVGGVLVAHFGWRAVFVLNIVPATLTGVLALALRTPESEGAGGAGAARSGRIDPVGALLLAVTLVCSVHALVAVPADGITRVTAAVGAAAVVSGACLVRHERRARDPLVPSAVLGSPPVAAALAVLVCASAAMLGALFAVMYLLQDGLGQDPLRGSLTALPGAAAMILAAPLAPVLTRRLGPRRTVTPAALALAAGAALLSGAGPTAAAPWSACTGFVLLGAGFGTVMAAATAVAVREAPAEHAGVTGGLQQTAMNIGPAVGIAAATAVMSGAADIADGTGRALLLLASFAVLGAVLALRLPSGGPSGSARRPSAALPSRPDPVGSAPSADR